MTFSNDDHDDDNYVHLSVLAINHIFTSYCSFGSECTVYIRFAHIIKMLVIIKIKLSDVQQKNIGKIGKWEHFPSGYDIPPWCTFGNIFIT